jgi:hypothetical protein
VPDYDAHFALVGPSLREVRVPVRATHEARVGGLFAELVVSDAEQNLPRAIIEPPGAPSMDALVA